MREIDDVETKMYKDHWLRKRRLRLMCILGYETKKYDISEKTKIKEQLKS